MTEVTREVFEITVKDLTEKLERCRSKCATLEESNTDLMNRYSQLSTDLGDVISFLKLRLEQKRDELSELTERLEGLDAVRTQEQHECRDMRDKLEGDMKRMQSELTSEVQMLTTKLNSLEEFRRMREKLSAERSQLELQLEQQRQEAEERVYQANRQRVIDSDQLQKDCVKNIASVAQAFQEATRQRVNQTTHRTLRENICLTAQMALIADKARHLDSDNASLRARAVENSRVLGALEWSEQSLVSATRRHEVELARLQDRNRALAEELQQRSQQAGLLEQQRCRVGRLEARLAEQQGLLEAAAVQHTEQALLVERLTEELHQQTEDCRRLQTVVAHAGSVVRRALTVTPASKGGEPRRGLLDQLLTVLTTAALRDQRHRLRPLPPAPADQLPPRLSTGALGITPGGDGALRLKEADSLIRELEEAAADYRDQ